MSDRIGTISFESGHDEIFNWPQYGPAAHPIQKKWPLKSMRRLRRSSMAAQAAAKLILRRNEEKLHAVAAYLLEHETMNAEEFEQVFACSGWNQNKPAAKKMLEENRTAALSCFAEKERLLRWEDINEPSNVFYGRIERRTAWRWRRCFMKRCTRSMRRIYAAAAGRLGHGRSRSGCLGSFVFRSTTP